MKAVQFEQYGPPDVLHIAEVATPVPSASQVQIAVHAAGVNPADYKWRAGMLAAFIPLRLPHIVGYDVAGVVSAIGADVQGLAVGDRVAATVNAGYSEFAVAEAAHVAPMPAGMDFAQAAALPCPALTGLELIEEGVQPQAGQTVLVTGATGGVGRFAVKAANAMGVRVIAAVRRAYFDAAMALGASGVIALGEDLPAGLQFDHVADTVGGQTVAPLCHGLKAGGRIVSASSVPIPPDGLPTAPVFFAYHGDSVRLARILDLVAEGEIAMPVAKCLPLASAAHAQALVEAGGLAGRVVLKVDHD